MCYAVFLGPKSHPIRGMRPSPGPLEGREAGRVLPCHCK